MSSRVDGTQHRVVAVCNQKGGVGKTLTTFNLARAAAVGGARVLAVDLDPQGNLTSVAAAEPVPADQLSIADVLSETADDKLSEVIVPGIWPRVEVVPAAAGGSRLTRARNELTAAGLGREVRLQKALVEVRDDYDLILIDCPPSLDQLTTNGLTAADATLIVTQPRLFAADGLAALLQTIDQVRQYFNPGLEIGGVLVNQYDGRTVAARHWHAELTAAAEARGFPLLDPPVPPREALVNALEAGAGLDQWGSGAAELADIYRSHLATIVATVKEKP